MFVRMGRATTRVAPTCWVGCLIFSIAEGQNVGCVFCAHSSVFREAGVMECLSVASRVTPQAAGGPKSPNKLFCISPKKGPFLEPLGNYCINWLLVLYYECGSRNGLWGPSGI